MSAKYAKNITAIASNLVELVLQFRKGEAAKDFEFWNIKPIFNPTFGYQELKPLFESLIADIKGMNPEMISEHYIKHRLIWEFLVKQTITVNQDDHLYDKVLAEEAKKIINDLVNFTIWQPIDTPVANLLVGQEPITLLDVTFIEATLEDLKLWEKNLKSFWHDGASHVKTMARVKFPGDEQTAIPYAKNKIYNVLDVMRAFCIPFGDKSVRQVALVGDFIPYTSTPMRINESKYLSTVGRPNRAVILAEDVLNKLNSNQWQLIDNFFRKTLHNEIERKLRNCIHWLSESMKPDTNNANYIRISIALETLVGGEPADEELKVRGITAMLAERAAFIAGEDLEDRKNIDKAVRTYYKLRGGIVHGSEADVTMEEIKGFGNLVRRVALSLLKKTDELGNEINNINKLEDWIRSNRYSLPEDLRGE